LGLACSCFSEFEVHDEVIYLRSLWFSDVGGTHCYKISSFLAMSHGFCYTVFSFSFELMSFYISFLFFQLPTDYSKVCCSVSMSLNGFCNFSCYWFLFIPIWSISIQEIFSIFAFIETCSMA
jgi:hypothetical protein